MPERASLCEYEWSIIDYVTMLWLIAGYNSEIDKVLVNCFVDPSRSANATHVLSGVKVFFKQCQWRATKGVRFSVVSQVDQLARLFIFLIVYFSSLTLLEFSSLTQDFLTMWTHVWFVNFCSFILLSVPEQTIGVCSRFPIAISWPLLSTVAPLLTTALRA